MTGGWVDGVVGEKRVPRKDLFGWLEFEGQIGRGCMKEDVGVV